MAGILSTFHYSPLKNVQVVRYSTRTKTFSLDSSYRLNTLGGKRIRNVDNVERRAQAELAPGTAHQARALATLPAQGDCREGTTPLNCKRVGIEEFGHPSSAAQKVPMLENIQYQNQMIRPVPPHAAT